MSNKKNAAEKMQEKEHLKHLESKEPHYGCTKCALEITKHPNAFTKELTEMDANEKRKRLLEEFLKDNFITREQALEILEVTDAIERHLENKK